MRIGRSDIDLLPGSERVNSAMYMANVAIVVKKITDYDDLSARLPGRILKILA